MTVLAARAKGLKPVAEQNLGRMIRCVVIERIRSNSSANSAQLAVFRVSAKFGGQVKFLENRKLIREKIMLALRESLPGLQ